MASQWERHIDTILGASSEFAAHMATDALIDDALPGGAAPADDAADLIRAIVARPELRLHPYRSCLLWILVLLRRWAGVYHAARATGRTISESVLANEDETVTSLATAAAAIAGMVGDGDPESRSMVYLLLGSAEAMPAVMDVLRLRASEDPSDLARACAVEGAAVAAIRFWPHVDSDFLAWLRGLALNGDELVRGRLRHVREGRAVIHSEGVARDVLLVASSDLPEEGPFWPVERI